MAESHSQDAILDDAESPVFSKDLWSSMRFRDPSYKPKVLKKSSTSFDSDDFDPEKETRLLVLYTGGTIGMKVHGGGTYTDTSTFIL